MTLHDYILEHAEDFLDLPEQPDPEAFEFCRFWSAPGNPYGYTEEYGYDDEAYEEAMREWEKECERIIDELEFNPCSELYLIVDGTEVEDFDEILAYLERQIDQTEGCKVWIA